MKNHRIKDMLAGAVIASMLFTLGSTAFATMTGKTIEAFTGIKVYVNDHIVEPKDAGGNPVDIFVYNGTTYLPIRAIGNALGLPVQYDASTETAYIGTHRSETPVAYLSEFDYFSGSSYLDTAINKDDNLKQTHSYVISDDFDRTYKLNGQYSRLTGVLFQEYDKRSGTIYSRNACLRIYGDGELLYSREFDKDTSGLDPENIDIDLTGVLELRVYFADGADSYGASSYWAAYKGPLSLGEMALYT